jgi:hypothetical protein
MPKVEVTLELSALPRLSGETMAFLKASAQACADCHAILKYVVAGDRVGPALRKDGSTFTVDDQKQHILELKGMALTKEHVTIVRSRAGTCREKDGTGCFYCARILDSITKEGLLREWPQDNKYEQIKLTVDNQRAHLMLEFGVPVVWEEVPS